MIYFYTGFSCLCQVISIETSGGDILTQIIRIEDGGRLYKINVHAVLR